MIMNVRVAVIKIAVMVKIMEFTMLAKLTNVGADCVHRNSFYL